MAMIIHPQPSLISDLVAENRRLRTRLATLESNANPNIVSAEREIFIGGPVVIFRWGIEKNWPIEYVSPNVTLVFGYDVATLYAKDFSFASLVHPDDISNIAGEVIAFSADPHIRCFEQEYRLRTAQDEYRWFYDFTAIIRDETGKPTHYHGYLLDITERRLAEEHYRATERAFSTKLEKTLAEQQAILDNAVVGITLLRDRIVVWNNRKIELLFGYEKDALMGACASLVFPDQTSFEAFGQAAYPAMCSGQPYTTRQQYRHRDGHLFWAEVSGQFLDWHTPEKGAIWITRDVNNEVLAYAALRASEQYLSRVLAGSNDGFWDWEIATGLVNFSDSWWYMFGYQPNDFSQNVTSWRALVHPEDLPHAEQALIAHIQGQSAQYQLEIRMKHRTQGWVWSLVRGKVYARDAQGVAQRMAGTHTDITERKQAELELRRLNETLEHRVAEAVSKNLAQERLLIQQSRLAAMGEMLGNIAHQWRQPLNALALVLANIQDAWEYGELDDHYLQQTVYEGQRLIQKMSTTIDDFRNFFRPNREKQAFSPREVIQETLDLLDASFRHNQIDIFLAQCAQELVAWGYANEFSQVLLNVLNNAKDAILQAHPLQRKITISCECMEKMIVVNITDTGGGIPEEVLGRIFEPYFTTKHKGTGIGLYMSRMIMENSMHGSIDIKNVGDGVCVSLYCPCSNV